MTVKCFPNPSEASADAPIFLLVFLEDTSPDALNSSLIFRMLRRTALRLTVHFATNVNPRPDFAHLPTFRIAHLPTCRSAELTTCRFTDLPLQL
ncbi:MAG: hypothetical protein ACK4I8_07605 [Armatimonadota bacterium]